MSCDHLVDDDVDDDDDGVSDNDKMKPSHSSSRRSARCCGTRQDLATRSRRAAFRNCDQQFSTKSNSQLLKVDHHHDKNILIQSLRSEIVIYGNFNKIQLSNKVDNHEKNILIQSLCSSP